MSSSSSAGLMSDILQSNIMGFVPMVLIFIVFYVLLIRPQEKKRKEQEALVASVKKGEDILTHSGIYGKVEMVNDSDSTIGLEIAKNTVIKISKSAILEILSRNKEKTKNNL